MKNILSAQSGTAVELRKGDRLEIIDMEGGQVSDVFCVRKEDRTERLSAGRSIDYNDGIFLGVGSVIYSNRSNPLLTILADSCGRHDFLLPPCSLRMFNLVAGNSEHHPSCHENLSLSLGRYGISADEISTCFNVFMNVEVDGKGALKIRPPLSRSGDSVVFRAEEDLIVGMTACSHEETNGGTCKPIAYQIIESYAAAGRRLT